MCASTPSSVFTCSLHLGATVSGPQKAGGKSVKDPLKKQKYASSLMFFCLWTNLEMVFELGSKCFSGVKRFKHLFQRYKLNKKIRGKQKIRGNNGGAVSYDVPGS